MEKQKKELALDAPLKMKFDYIICYNLNMKNFLFLLLISYRVFVSGHGGCSSNENCTTAKNHTMSVNETMEEECCAFLSYNEKGTNI
jgi:hypothetical protein